MRRFLFVGEKPSRTAYRRGLTWQDGALAAKTLFDALDAAGITRESCAFVNLFGETPVASLSPKTPVVRERLIVFRSIAKIVTIVAMGSRVQRVLAEAGIPHLHIVHPAARGAIRAKAVYQQHAADVLLQGEPT